jgi:nitric oxide reductase NorQ protein
VREKEGEKNIMKETIIKPGHEANMQDYRIEIEPFYLPIQDEVELFQIAYENKLPLMLKGPTGCGKTRFLSYMAHRMGLPLITIACHEDLTASDLVGRYLLDGSTTRWQDGPLALAVRHGGICYLDEVVEARKDTTVVIHPLTDDRRVLPLEKRGQILEASDTFMLAISYNPGYQTVLKDLKQSTKQRFITLDFDYPSASLEEEIIVHESGVDRKTAVDLRKIAEKIRGLKDRGLDEGVSTRLLIYAGVLIKKGVEPRRACEVAMIKPITDDVEIQKTLTELVSAVI